MKKTIPMFSILLCLVLASAVNAQLTIINGSLSTPDGVNATGNWSATGFIIEWNISEQTDGSWFYEYFLSDTNGRMLSGSPSHFTLEVSPNVTRADFWDFSSAGVVEFGDKDGIATAMKLDWEANSYGFFSNRAPVLGSFYTKDGYDQTYGWNSAQNADGYYIYRPDTDTVIPEPSTLMLLGAGLAGVIIRRRKKTCR